MIISYWRFKESIFYEKTIGEKYRTVEAGSSIPRFYS